MPGSRPLAAATTLFVLSGFAVAYGRPVSLSGEWMFFVESAFSLGTPAVTFAQTGNGVTGYYSSTMFGKAPLKGTVKDRIVTFVVAATYEERHEELSFTGEYDGSGEIRGKYQSRFGGGRFTAVRKFEQGPAKRR